MNLKTSDMDGTTGVISAGWNYASPDNAYEMGFGLTGYAGARKGVTGEVRALEVLSFRVSFDHMK